MSFEQLKDHFGKYGIDLPNEQRFAIEGPRNSIAIYSVRWNTTVDVWFGKSDDDSGGLSLQGSINSPLGIEQLERMLKLHTRFMQSGRRKVLRHFEERKHNGR